MSEHVVLIKSWDDPSGSSGDPLEEPNPEIGKPLNSWLTVWKVVQLVSSS